MYSCIGQRASRVLLNNLYFTGRGVIKSQSDICTPHPLVAAAVCKRVYFDDRGVVLPMNYFSNYTHCKH